MSLKVFEVNKVQLISCLTAIGPDVLQFYCHDKTTERSYTEIVPLQQFVERIRTLNKRVHFPTNAVRAALSGSNPMYASFAYPEGDGSVEAKDGAGATRDGDANGNPEEQQGQRQEEPYTVLSLKYRISGATAPLKWEWHLTVMNSASFYRIILKVSLSTASQLNEKVQYLLDVIKKKDVEVKQYITEGAQLRRTTVATEPFDVSDFTTHHSPLLANVSAYAQVGQALDDRSIAVPTEKIDTEVTKPQKVATDSTKTLSPRNRKRMVVETGIRHVERSVLQRRREPKLQYKDSQSQEDNIDELPVEKKPLVKAEQVEPEATIDTANAAIEHEGGTGYNELDEILEMIDKTTNQTKKMLEDRKNI